MYLGRPVWRPKDEQFAVLIKLTLIFFHLLIFFQCLVINRICIRIHIHLKYWILIRIEFETNADPKH
jgi:hypothetical protein